MKRGETIMISTHSLGLVKSMCSRGLVIDKGKIVFDGDSSDSVTYYLDEIVRAGG